MPTTPDNSSPTVAGSEFRLWWHVPEGCWLRSQGRTRVLLIDDQYTTRRRMLDVSDNDDLTSDEALLRRWLNVDLQFLPMPDDYRWTEKFPEGTFSDAWFDGALSRVLADPRPIAAVMLDLLYGDETRVQEASGRRFLARLRHSLPSVPVLVLSNVIETPEVDGILKRGDDDTGETSFQDYLPKVDSQDGRPLLQRLAEKLIEWGDIADPDLSAFSAPMRQLARRTRQIVLRSEQILYEEVNAGRFPRPVVVTGEFGSGKNYVAMRLHAMSSRRHVPLLTVNFGGLDADRLPVTLFGSKAFSDAAQCFEVRTRDGAVIRPIQATVAQRNPPVGMVYLGEIGVLQHADIAGQPFGQNQKPLRGSVLLDEIGTAPEGAQTRLLGVLNNGRFTPHLGNVQIPTGRAIDVWFLVTLSPEGETRLRPDLGTRLAKGYRLDVPPLWERAEDTVALAMKMAHAAPEASPQEVFTDGALRLLDQRLSAMQVRDLDATIRRLGDVTAKRPYSARDLEAAAAPVSPRKDAGRAVAGMESAASRTDPSEAGVQPASAAQVAPPGAVDSETQGRVVRGTVDDAAAARTDGLAILAQWRSGAGPSYSIDPRNPVALRGRGGDVLGGVAAAVLSYLEVCATVTATTGQYSSARTWNFFAGTQGTKSPDARTRIAPLFLIDEEASLNALRRSDALLWLALDVAGRRSEVVKLLGMLEADSAQAGRVSAARARRARTKSEQEE